MSIMNYVKMTAKEKADRLAFKCKHGHNGFSHPKCYDTDNKVVERVGFLDIEASNLKANFGIMLSYSILADDGELLTGLMSTADVKDGTLDKRILKLCVLDMLKFDRLVTHYGTYYDIPYLRTRCLMQKVKFPKHGLIKLSDTWKMAKNCLAISSNRQDVIAECLRGKTVKSRIHGAAWIKAVGGDAKSLRYILDHNVRDVYDLRDNYLALLPFVKLTSTSI